MSILYTSSNAMKTDFTRFGRRTYGGIFNDLKTFFCRYFWNNFLESEKHDII